MKTHPASHSLNRRTFLRNSLYAAAAASVPWSRVLGANDDIRVAVVGFNGRGQSHINGFKDLPGVRLVALCDVDKVVLEKGLAKVNKGDDKVTGYTDIRRLLENKDVDVISIATPNHWHSLATIWACQAGKDVYVEKPISHNVWEGRKAVEAARKYNRIVQGGTQSRSSGGIKQAVEWVAAGNLGKILLARGTCYKRRPSIGTVPEPIPVPTSVDYDLWCGPAPMEPVRRPKFHYDWHWIWDYGNGDLGNQGVHQVDIARWFLGEQELAPKVFSIGGRLGYTDDGQTPNTQMIYQEYAKAPLMFEVRGLPSKAGSNEMDKYMGSQVGVLIHCENGHVLVANYTGATAYDKDGKVAKEWKGADDHFANFITAVRSRQPADLNADILQGHLSAGLCHTGNISYRVGTKTSPEAIREAIKGNKEALETFGRMAEHLAANDVNINNDKLTLGAFLTMDPKTEKFVANHAADELLTRKYRVPFVVPEKV